MQEGCGIMAFYVMVSIGVALIDLLMYVSEVALMQEGCDIIGNLCYGVMRGSKAGKL